MADQQPSTAHPQYHNGQMTPDDEQPPAPPDRRTAQQSRPAVPETTSASTTTRTDAQPAEEFTTDIPRHQTPESNGKSVDADSIPDLTDSEPVPANNFAFTPKQLHRLQEHRSLPALEAFGGVRGLAIGLRTDPISGIHADEATLEGGISFDEAVAAGREDRTPIRRELSSRPDHGHAHALRILERHEDGRFVDRKRVFGANRLPKRHQKSFLRLMWLAFNDKLLILLSISAVISLVIGIYQSVSAEEDSSNIEWVDGVTVVVAIAVIVLASAATDWQKDRKFRKLTERKDERDVFVVRSGRDMRVSVYDVLVGDLLHVAAGDVIAVDGILVEGSNLQVDESSISGESEMVHKMPADRMQHQHAPGDADPFILSGTTVSRGIGRYLVTNIGKDSTYGRMLMGLRSDVEETPLQAKLGRFGQQLITFGVIAGAIFFLVLLIRWLVNLDDISTLTPSQKAEDFFHILILAVTVVVITVPEGLALNVTVALAFATKRMLKDNNLVRLIRSCEIMGNATTICSDKTGTLTQNKMSVVAGRIGLEGQFDDMDVADEDSAPTYGNPLLRGNRTASTGRLVSQLSQDVKDLIRSSTALNSTAFEGDDSQFIGMSTETALLKFAREHLGMSRLREERANADIVTILPFDSSRKWMATLIKLPSGRYRLLLKGAAEIVLEYCAFSVTDPTWKLQTDTIPDDTREGIRDAVHGYASKMLRPVALAYRDFDESQIFLTPDDEPDSINLDWLASGMVLVSVFAIRDPLRPQVLESVRQCQTAGVFVRMVTGDNFLTAKAIATECGIYGPGGIAMDGRTFRKLSKAQMDQVVPRLQVLARSSPEDKLMLVTHLKEMGETVAVTGDGTNDALALKAADVGFAMGIQGTEVAKEAASIILLDDNFTSIISALSWGRTVNDAVKKFCQFQFTINIAAGILTVVSELEGEAIFTVVQLLWLNLIQDIMASLGLATDGPSPDFLLRKPEPRGAPIISITMWKMILLQAVYQLATVSTIYYGGRYGNWTLWQTENNLPLLRTFAFNVFIWMQTANQHNCRRVDNKIGIWYQGVLKNPWFLAVQTITIAGQAIIINKGGEAFDTVPLNGVQWGWSLMFGLVTIPLGAVIRQIPDAWVLAFFHLVRALFLLLTAPVRLLFGPCFRKLRLKKRQRKERKRTHGETASQEAGETKDDGEPEDHEMSHMESMVIQAGRAMLSPIMIQPAHLQVGPNGEDLDISRSQQLALAKAARDYAAREAARAGEEGAASSETRAVDLPGLIEASRGGRDAGSDKLEVHPGSFRKDPILTPVRAATGRERQQMPPSQDPAVQRYMPRGEDEDGRLDAAEAARLKERRRAAAARTAYKPRPGETKPRNGLSWEAFVRSKRR